ncbi:hypothetical protein AB9P05_17035 [Roseivirga sp. BDSF3-8]|uniref:hypothetical protein n=1 Tax=Roseivirga sp. BDSF3-8 TaxID=3241598 RepID=UPI003531FC13
MIIYGIMKAIKKKKEAKQPPVVGKGARKDTDTGSKGFDLEEILGEVLGEKKKEQPRQQRPVEEEVDDRDHMNTSQNRQKRRKLFDVDPDHRKPEEDKHVKPANKSSRYTSLNEMGNQKAQKLDELVSLDDRTRSSLEVVHLDDDDDEVGSHADILHALHDQHEFRKAFIMGEIIRKKY